MRQCQFEIDGLQNIKSQIFKKIENKDYSELDVNIDDIKNFDYKGKVFYP